MVIRAERSIMELEKTAGVNEPPVPRDRLLEPVRRFRPPSFQDIKDSFERAHRLSEIFYCGNGIWDDFRDYWRPPLRCTSNRVIGYLRGFRVLGEEIYRKRAVEGLEYLLNEQREDGGYPWYYRSDRGVYNRSDGLFDTGTAGRAFVEAYQALRDDRYLEASNRIAEWEKACPVSDNNNYNMFAVWHLAAHYNITGDGSCLESAIHKTREGGFPRQFPSGGWPGHNSWMWYHGIILRGMVELYRSLPQGHPFTKELFGPMTAAVNRAVREQLSTGEIPPNPGIRKKRHTCSFIAEALAPACSIYGPSLNHVLNGVMRFRLRSQPDDELIQEIMQAPLQSPVNGGLPEPSEPVWQADMSCYREDPVWGEMLEGAFNCWYPCREPVPGRVRWSKAARGQRITVSDPDFLGGIGFKVPKGTLTPHRRCILFVRAMIDQKPGHINSENTLFLASAWSGSNRGEWDPFTACEFTRENASFGEFSTAAVPFSVHDDAAFVYFWIMPGGMREGESLSFIVENASVYDFGPLVPKWRSPVPDDEPHLALEVNGTYLDEVRA